MPLTADLDLEPHRRELTALCYRYFANWADAEDAVQETMLRAWRSADGFDGRSSVRTWLHSIAVHVCLDTLKSPARRVLPFDLTSPGDVPADGAGLRTQPEATWIGPAADADLAADPAQVVVRRETVRLAFIAALQRLPPRQRAVVLLRDVLAWSAKESADLLGLSVAAANSALARARSALADHDSEPALDRVAEQRVLDDYVRAFERYDVSALVGLLADDAEFTMPPFELWLRGVDSIERWWRGPGTVCRGSKTIVTGANGQPAVAVYHPVSSDRWQPFALHVLTVDEGRIAAITHFMGAAVFEQFGLPPEL